MVSFYEKVSMCHENIVEFADIINKIYNNNSKGYFDVKIFLEKNSLF